MLKEITDRRDTASVSWQTALERSSLEIKRSYPDVSPQRQNERMWLNIVLRNCVTERLRMTVRKSTWDSETNRSGLRYQPLQQYNASVRPHRTTAAEILTTNFIVIAPLKTNRNKHPEAARLSCLDNAYLRPLFSEGDFGP